MHIYPDYYKKFKCIADKCKHNCCIGWEIDIDNNTYDFYKKLTGDFAKKIIENISTDETPHFVLKENDRCPFLNDKNLCDIIINLSEEHICDICKEHPRFHNELPDRVESGIGLCCEQAARIILSQKEKVTLISDEKIDTDDEIIVLRDKVMDILQDRANDITNRLNSALTACNTTTTKRSIENWCDVLLSLEQLDKSWGEILLNTKTANKNVNYQLFDIHMKDRQHEYEQFVVYLLYRHFANSPDLQQAQSVMRFIASAYEFLYALGATTYYSKGDLTFDDQVELVRLFSSEIEYSDENLYTLFDMV